MVEVGQVWADRNGPVRIVRVMGDRVRFADLQGDHAPPLEIGLATFLRYFSFTGSPQQAIEALNREISASPPAQARGSGRCRECQAPAARLREGRCIYCDFATQGGNLERGLADDLVARHMADEHPTPHATARLDRGLRSERVPLTATARQLALPHPW